MEWNGMEYNGVNWTGLDCNVNDKEKRGGGDTYFKYPSQSYSNQLNILLITAATLLLK